MEPGSQVAILCVYLAAFTNLEIYLNVNRSPEWAETIHGVAAIAPIFIWRFGAPFTVALGLGLLVQIVVLVANRKFLREHLADLRKGYLSVMIWLAGEGLARATYDPATGRLSERAPQRAASEPVQGWYRWLGGTLVVFYGAEGRVWLRIGAVVVACTGPQSVDWVRQANGMARLSIVDREDVVASVVYFGGDSSGVPPELDFTATASEDFDFGEFIRHRLNDEEGLRRTFGPDINYDAGMAMSPAARSTLDGLAVPSRDVDLGPLESISPALYRAAPNPSPLDHQIQAFVEALDDAPAHPPGGGPGVMPLALGLTDQQRQVLHAFASRAALRATSNDVPALLVAAAVAVVLGGLDCELESSSLRGAVLAADDLAMAMCALGVNADEIIGPAGRRVGTLGEWRLLRLKSSPRVGHKPYN